MKIIRYKNPNVTSITTTLTSSASYGDTTINVTDASNFNINDILLIEEQGNELCEIVYVQSILSNTITLSNSINLPHESSITITKINYDKYKIESSNDNITFKTVTTDLLDYSNLHNNINYTDSDIDASDNKYYKISFVNSITTTEDLQDTLYKENNFAYISIDEYRLESGFIKSEVTDSEINDALVHGLEWIHDNAYNNTIFKTHLKDNSFTIDLNGMLLVDWNADNIINEDDMVIYEIDNNNVRTYISHLVAKVFPNSSRIIFQEKVPRNNKELVFNVKIGFKSQSAIRETVKTINKLIATNWLLMNINTKQIKGGVSSWSAGGTSINKNIGDITESIDKNYKEAERLLSQMTKIYMKKTKMRRDNDRGGILSASGNTYNV